MGLISGNNSRFPQLAILHVISAEGLPLLAMLFLFVCLFVFGYVSSLNVLELESRAMQS